MVKAECGGAKAHRSLQMNNATLGGLPQRSLLSKVSLLCYRLFIEGRADGIFLYDGDIR